VNNELERILKEAVLVYFLVPLSRNSPGGTELNHENPFSHYIRFPGRDLNPGTPEYEGGVKLD
jgi:hypothetical protein